jgi:hypothetical protein
MMSTGGPADEAVPTPSTRLGQACSRELGVGEDDDNVYRPVVSDSTRRPVIWQTKKMIHATSHSNGGERDRLPGMEKSSGDAHSMT